MKKQLIITKIFPFLFLYSPFLCFCFVFLWLAIPIKDSLSIASKWKCGQCSSAFLAVQCTEMLHILVHCSEMLYTEMHRTVQQKDGGASLANMVKNYMSTGFFGQPSGQIYFQTTLAACICPICKMYLFKLKTVFV